MMGLKDGALARSGLVAPFRSYADADSRELMQALDWQYLEKADQLSLSIGIAFDVALGRLDRAMTGKLLNVTKRPTGLVDEASCLSDEGAPARMRRASLKADCPIELMEPIDDRFGRHRLTIAFGSDHRSF
jgi:hypothetical protein